MGILKRLLEAGNIVEQWFSKSDLRTKNVNISQELVTNAIYQALTRSTESKTL